MVSALVLLLQTEASPGRAVRQLGLRFGHVAYGRPAYLDAFFSLYAEWLVASRLEHSPEVLRTWIEKDYCPGECRCDLQLIGCPATLLQDQPAALCLRARDTSVKPWRFRASSNAGIHAYFLLYDPADTLIQHGYAGLFDRTIDAGESIDLTLALPGLSRRGRYRLFVDMVDERHCEFTKVGSEPLEVGLEVR